MCAANMSATGRTEMSDLDLLSATDAAEILGVNHQTVLWRAARLREKGHVLGVKLGRDWVFRPWEVVLLRDLAPAVGRPKRRGNEMVQHIWVIELEPGRYLGDNDYATGDYQQARRYPTRAAAKVEQARLLGWPKARVLRIAL